MFPLNKIERYKTFAGNEVKWRWDNFTPDEIRSKGNGEIIIDPAFMDRIQKLREWCGFALPVSSGYRDPEYNALVSSTGENGPHTKGAIDLKVSGEKAHILLGHAFTMGFMGIGVSQKGPHSSRFIHIDNREKRTLWSY